MTILTIIAIMIFLAGALFSAVEYYANKHHKKPELTSEINRRSDSTSYCADGITNLYEINSK